MKTYIIKVDDYGKRWYLKVDDYGKRWYLDGKCHREDGPAVEYTDGTKLWYLDGKLNRTDGHAVEYAGNKYWYLNDVQYTEAEWSKRVQKKAKSSCVGKIVEVDGVKYKLVEA